MLQLTKPRGKTAQLPWFAHNLRRFECIAIRKNLQEYLDDMASMGVFILGGGAEFIASHPQEIDSTPSY